MSVRAWIDGEGQAKAGLNFHTSKITLHRGSSANTAAQESKPTAKESAKASTAKVEVHEAVVVNTGGTPDDDDLPF